MAWVESVSPSFRARHESRDREDVDTLLEGLERLRDRLTALIGPTPGDVEVVVHGSPLALDLAQPLLPLARRRDAPAARRYRAGTAQDGRIDVLAPRLLKARASRVPGSEEMLARTAARLYARLALEVRNPALVTAAHPLHPRAGDAWGWLAEGAAAWFGGQAEHARPAVARRLREGRTPRFPPARPDAWLLGTTLIDLLAREEGEQAVLDLAADDLKRAPKTVLVDAFSGRLSIHTEAAWRSHLERIAHQAAED
jgi:hypothetical protein